MENAIEIVVWLFGGVGLLFVAYLVGSSIEAAHFRKLAQWEQELSGIMVSDMKRVPPNWHIAEASLVVGEAVIATDKYKVFTAGLRNLFGGRVRGYETLMERARRQAIVRMLWHAQQYGANVVWNVRLETSTIQGKRQGKSGGVEVMAYGTAMKVKGQ
ncbi:MAG TPA: heavy metal-binding domain-containing protein [Thermoguttaceae bacterium]|nr:heavy metal-binding domain-containing protein [Thermoguttaceae bacterium]